MANFDYSTLYYGKYALTFIYFLSYFVVTYLAVRFLCDNKKILNWVTYIYAILLVLSGITMTYNYFVNNQLDGDEYTFSRWLMGIAQSPLVAFFTIASSKLFNKLQTQS